MRFILSKQNTKSTNLLFSLLKWLKQSALHISWVTNSYRRKSSCIHFFICITSVAEAQASSVNFKEWQCLYKEPLHFSPPLPFPPSGHLTHCFVSLIWITDERDMQISCPKRWNMIRLRMYHQAPSFWIWVRLSKVTEKEISPGWSRIYRNYTCWMKK